MGPEYDGAFDSSVTSVAAARQLVREALTEWGLHTDDVMIAVSELASNAVRHAGTGYSVELEHLENAVKLTVKDTGPGSISTPTPSARHGRGLAIVGKLAADWGVHLNENRTEKAVWAVFLPPINNTAPDLPAPSVDCRND